MLQATFKLCAGSSYRHVRNMKGELPLGEGVRGGDWASGMWLSGESTGQGAGEQATQALVRAVPLIG